MWRVAYLIVNMVLFFAEAYGEENAVNSMASRLVEKMAFKMLHLNHADHSATFGGTRLPTSLFLNPVALSGRVRSAVKAITYRRSTNSQVQQPAKSKYQPSSGMLRIRSSRSATVAHAGSNSFDELGRLWLGQGDVPVASYAPSDIGELFGGALFLVLKRFKEQLGPVYLLPTGPTSSFLVISDPKSARHVLESYSKYEKGLVREISQFLFGDGFAVADGRPWKIRRRAMAPTLHIKYLDAMVQKTFASCSMRTAEVLSENRPGGVVNMEKLFSELTLDIIGKAVFNYDFNSVSQNGDNPVIDAVYTALKETEARSLDFAPLWKLPGDLPTKISSRQKRAADAVALIRKTTEDLIEKCRLQVEAEEAAGTAAEFNEDNYLTEADPSILRFLIASHEEVRSSQLRDDLLSMLVAGHETTASVLTWTLYLLTKNPDKMARVQKEIDDSLSDKIEIGNLTMKDLRGVNYLRWCVAESMRLYPHPPVLIRRALEDDVLPGGQKVPKGQDVMISVYNIHHSESVWSNSEDFLPERWSKYSTPRDNPNERNTDFRYIPFGGGARKCIGDQFALLETYTVLAVLLYKFNFRLLPGQDIAMTTGATIHTTNGVMMTYVPRRGIPLSPKESIPIKGKNIQPSKYATLRTDVGSE